MAANLIVIFIGLVVLFQLWYLNRSSFTGLGFWLTGWGLFLTGTVLITLRNTLPDVISIVMGNSLAGMGLLLHFVGLCRFFHFRVPRLLRIGLPIVFLVFVIDHSYFTFIQDNLLAREYNVTIALTLLAGLNIWLLVKGIAPLYREISRGAAVAYAFISFIFIARIVGFNLINDNGNDFMQAGFFDSLILLLAAGAYMLLIVNLSLLVNERLHLTSRQMQEKIVKNEKELQAIFKTIAVGFAVLSNRVVKEVNDATCRLLGYTREEMIGQTTRLWYFSDEEFEKAGHLYDEVRVSGTVSSEIRLRRKDGRPVQVIKNLTALDSADLAAGSVMVLVDITERKTIEEALVKSELDLKATLQAIPDLLFEVSDDLTISNYHAPESTDLFAPPEAFLGKPIAEIMPAEVTDIIQKAIQEAQNSPNGLHRGAQYHLDLPKGPRWFELSVSRKNAPGSGRTSFLALIQDITLRKQYEEALERERWRLNNIINGARVGTWEWNMQTGETVFNDIWAQMLGYTLEELAPVSIRTWEKLAHPDDLKAAYTLLQKHSDGELPFYEIEFRMKHKDGRWVWIQDRGQIFQRSADGRPLMMFGTHIDISELKQAEAKALEIETLKQANKAKSELLTNVSHELRTPLTSIKGFLETLLQTDVKWPRKQQIEFLNGANRETDHLMILIRNLLDMSRIESGKLNIEKRPQRFEAVLGAAEARLKQITQLHTLVMDIAEGLPPVPVDNFRIAQVLTNLVENAAKFSPPGTPITIRVEQQAARIIVSVIDQGIGISAENIDKLFNRFFQVENVEAGKTAGIGLGLAICKGIIEAHGGQIWVNSRLEKGSQFCFSLPLDNPIETPVAPIPPAVAELNPLSPER